MRPRGAALGPARGLCGESCAQAKSPMRHDVVAFSAPARCSARQRGGGPAPIRRRSMNCRLRFGPCSSEASNGLSQGTRPFSRAWRAPRPRLHCRPRSAPPRTSAEASLTLPPPIGAAAREPESLRFLDILADPPIPSSRRRANLPRRTEGLPPTSAAPRRRPLARPFKAVESRELDRQPRRAPPLSSRRRGNLPRRTCAPPTWAARIPQAITCRALGLPRSICVRTPGVHFG